MPPQIEQVDLMELALAKKAEDDEKRRSDGREEPAPLKLTTLIDVQFELLRPYGELRGFLPPMSEREAWLLQARESEEGLRVGRLVEAKVGAGG